MNESLEENFRHIRTLAEDIEARLNGTSTADQRLKNELAGMFAVTIVATYEAIVKETLISYAGTIHNKYREHIEKDFKRLNARISIDDLYKYSHHFGLTDWAGIGAKKNATIFHKMIIEKKKIVERRFRSDLLVNYKNLFIWRNSYAHERATSATFNDVYNSHRVAQYVIRTFVKAFDES